MPRARPSFEKHGLCRVAASREAASFANTVRARAWYLQPTGLEILTTMTTMNIYQALEQDHRMFETLLDRLVEASEDDDDEYKEVLDQLRYGVIAHAHAEERICHRRERVDENARQHASHKA